MSIKTNPAFWTMVMAMLVLLSCKTSEISSCIDTEKVKPEMMCIEIYEPVCGCDGKTYSNACFADKAGLRTYTPGACK